jgi:uncharacterized YccA/Bax inhibitor family protein
MRNSNPILNEKAFSGVRAADADAMTINGTIQKTAGLLFLLVCSGAYTWAVTRADGASAAMPWAMAGVIGGLVSILIMAFKKEWSPILAPAYALAEGLFLGAISAILEARFHGIVLNAAALTVGTLGVLLLVYRLGWVKATENFKMGIVAATGAIAVLYIVDMVLMMFGKQVPFIHQSGMIGIGFSILVVGIAALNLVLDFDFIENGAAAGAPRYMEWFAGVGLLVTLVWLYVEFLRLLAKLNSRR